MVLVLFREFFLKVDDHFGENVFEDLVTVFLDGTIGEMGSGHEIPSIFNDFNVTHCFHNDPYPNLYPVIIGYIYTFL
jgi:hypothetical protein